MAYCGQAVSVNHQPTHSEAAALKCRRWSCLDCHPDNCRRVQRQALAGKPDLFLTLTVNPAFGESPTERANVLRDAWQVIRRRALAEASRPWTRRPGWKQWRIAWKGYAKESPTFRNRVRLRNGRLPFTVAVEEHESGEPHMHLLCRADWIDWRWLKAQLEDLTGAFIIDVQRIKSPERAARYVAKYIGKGPAKFEGLKRHWRSQDYILPDDQADQADERPRPTRWRYDVTLETFAGWFQSAGWRVDWRGNSLVAMPP